MKSVEYCQWTREDVKAFCSGASLVRVVEMAFRFILTTAAFSILFTNWTNAEEKEQNQISCK